MEDVMVTCEDDSMEEEEDEDQEVQVKASKDEGKKQPAATRRAPVSAMKTSEAARGKREPQRASPAPQPEADPADSDDEEEMEEEGEEAAMTTPDQWSKRQNQTRKRLQEEEKRGRTYHEFNEEEFFDRNKIQVCNNQLDDAKDELVCLDASTCDLQFRMDKDRYGGLPSLYSIFPFLWSGSRATHGVKKGKVYFEIKRTENLPLKEGYSEFPLLRVGWSVARSGPQLGEDDLSFAYDSRGLKATSGRFETYAKSFREYDLIGCYADLDGDSVEISFSKNGEDLGQAFHFNKSSLEDHALLPHILCKGCGFQVNFGQKLKPWHKPRDGFSFLHDLQSEDLTRTPVAPRYKKKCEMLMMVGFPASGKTTWVLKHMQENPDKNFMHLSVDRFIPQVKTVGLDEPEYNKVKDQDIKMATKCLRRVLLIAGSRRANYIIDQCSLDKNDQEWKLFCFTGFTCKAVLMVPEVEEWERRLEERRNEGEIYPESVLLRLKAICWIPKMNKTSVSKIITPGLRKTGALKIFLKLKMEARAHPLTPKKGTPFTPNATSKKSFPHHSRPHPYRAPVPLMSSWRPRTGGFQNSRALSPPRQDRFFGRNNDFPENRPGFQNSRPLSPPRPDRFFGRNDDFPEIRLDFQNSRPLSPPRRDRFFGRNDDFPENRPGFQNSRALSPPRRDRFFGRNNDFPENRPGFQNSRALSPPRHDRFFGRNNDFPENRPPSEVFPFGDCFQFAMFALLVANAGTCTTLTTGSRTELVIGSVHFSKISSPFDVSLYIDSRGFFFFFYANLFSVYYVALSCNDFVTSTAPCGFYPLTVSFSWDSFIHKLG